MALFNMNGYGIYVWSAYSITLIVFAINIAAIILEKNRIKKILKQFSAEKNES